MGSCLLHMGTQDIFVTDTLFIIMKVFNQVVKGHSVHNCDRLKKECIFSKFPNCTNSTQSLRKMNKFSLRLNDMYFYDWKIYTSFNNG